MLPYLVYASKFRFSVSLKFLYCHGHWINKIIIILFVIYQLTIYFTIYFTINSLLKLNMKIIIIILFKIYKKTSFNENYISNFLSQCFFSFCLLSILFAKSYKVPPAFLSISLSFRVGIHSMSFFLYSVFIRNLSHTILGMYFFHSLYNFAFTFHYFPSFLCIKIRISNRQKELSRKYYRVDEYNLDVPYAWFLRPKL